MKRRSKMGNFTGRVERGPQLLSFHSVDPEIAGVVLIRSLHSSRFTSDTADKGAAPGEGNRLKANLRSALSSTACVLFLVTAPLAAHALPVTEDPSKWKLTLADEFSGSTLDSTKWANRLPGKRNDAINTANAVSVGGGVLTISTYTDAGTNYTGMIGSQDKFEQTYGYFEARMKFNSAPGEWSAFWLTSPVFDGHVDDPATWGTEIDIVEHRAVNGDNKDISGKYVSAVHWDGYGTDHKQVSTVHAPDPGVGNGTWHTYGLKWSSEGYEFFYDDKSLWVTTTAISARPEYMILSSEVRNANWAGTIPTGGYGPLGTSTTNVQVDYVHVYEAVPEPAALGAMCCFALALRRRRRR